MITNAFLFADGSCAANKTNPAKGDIGAWAALAVMGDQRQLLYGVTYPTTISRCELTPIIEGLRWIKAYWGTAPNLRITVYSDSEYTVKTLSGVNTRHKNMELWSALDEAAKGLKIRYVWRERNSLYYMTLCDAICGGLRHKMYDLITDQFTDPRNPEAVIPIGAIPEPKENDKYDEQL